MRTYTNKAMDKKQKAVLDKMKKQFMKVAANGQTSKVCDKVWTDWEAFASTAFNKSHSTLLCLRGLSDGLPESTLSCGLYGGSTRTAPVTLKRSPSSWKMAKRIGIDVLPPDVNESFKGFAVNKKTRSDPFWSGWSQRCR